MSDDCAECCSATMSSATTSARPAPASNCAQAEGFGPKFTVIVPVKRLDHAKSRLEVGELRPLFALAFARDVTEALLASPMVESVHVLTSDDRLPSLFPGGVNVLLQKGDGLNCQLENAFCALDSTFDGPTAVVNADLPALSSKDFETAASAALRHEAASFVPDADNSGTTAIFTQTRFDKMLFGHESNRRFESAGMRPIFAPIGMRRDVDTVDHLEQAAALGVSHWTTCALKTLRKLGRV